MDRKRRPLALTDDEKVRGWEIREVNGVWMKVLDREDELTKVFLTEDARLERRRNPLLAALRRALQLR